MACDKVVNSRDVTKFLKKAAFAAAFAAAVSPSPVMAVGIFDFTTNTTLFFDNFESGNFSSPAGGTWSVGPDVTVTNAAVPGPAEGNFYASLFRDSNTAGQGNLRANMSIPTSGDTVGIRFMVYIPSAADQNARGQFILDNGDFSTARAWVIPSGLSGGDKVLAVTSTGGATADTGLTYLPNTWQEWELRYVIGGLNFDVCVAGVCASGFTSATSGNINGADLFNGVADAGTLFLDAVPTNSSATPLPAALPLFATGIGGLGILGWRRKRKAQILGS